MNTKMSKFYRDIVTNFYRHELKPSEIIKVSRYRDTRAPIPFVSKGSVEITNPDGITTTLTVSDGPVPVEVTIPGEYTIKALEESTWICFSPIPFFARTKVPSEYSFIHFKTRRTLSRDLFYSDVIEIILRGSYTEFCKETNTTFVRKAGSFRFMRSTDRHSIITMEPNTLTIFIRGFKKKDWEVGIRPCEVVCERCKSSTGHCEKEDNIVSANDLLEYPEDGGKWRGWRWVKWTPALDSILAKRQEAMARSGVEIKSIVEITELKERRL